MKYEDYNKSQVSWLYYINKKILLLQMRKLKIIEILI